MVRTVKTKYKPKIAHAPAPVKGWNARDSYAEMGVEYAYKMVNWFPRATDLVLRRGVSQHATGLHDSSDSDAEVETLAVYEPVSGPSRMFAWADEYIYEVTGSGNAGSALVSGLTNARWQTTQFTTTGGNFLIAVNGEDDMQVYNGSSWSSINSGSTPSITGLATSDITNVAVHKERVWYVEQGSLSAWYTGIGAFAGALTEFPLGSVFRKGGTLTAIGSWTLDSGIGLDDYAVFITSEGEVAVYQGTNPNDADAWQLVGVYNVGTPLGPRCFEKFGADLLINTVDGVLPASKALSSGRTSDTFALTDIIHNAQSTAAQLYDSNNGWQIHLFYEGTMLIVNIPVNVGQQEQYVMNTRTGGWSRFTGMPASCWTTFNGDLYFGTTGEVKQAWTGTSDEGSDIDGEVVPAFSFFGKNSVKKFFNKIRPIIFVDNDISAIFLRYNTDFNDQTPTNQVSFPDFSVAVWDIAKWDIAIWGGGDRILGPRWYTITGIGYAGAPGIRITSSSANVRLISYETWYQEGGIL